MIDYFVFWDDMAFWNSCYTATKKKPRPPRYIGPKSKTAPRVQRVDRVARSSCRKVRR